MSQQHDRGVPGRVGAGMMAEAGEGIRPFRINIPTVTWMTCMRGWTGPDGPMSCPGVGWAYGIPRGYLKELAVYWRAPP